MKTIPVLTRRLRQARLRLFLQGMLDRAVLCVATTLAVGIAYVFIAPFLPETMKTLSEAWLLGGLAAIGLAASFLWSVRRAPTMAITASALDRRFNLQERVTTALALTPQEAATPAGEALIADTNGKLEPLAVRGQFSVLPKRSALVVPVQLAVLGAALLFYKPALEHFQAGNQSSKPGDSANADETDSGVAARKEIPKPITMPPDRANKSDELRKLEEELTKLYAEANNPNDPAKSEKISEKIEQVAAAEQRVQKFERQQAMRFQSLQEQLQKLGQVEAGAKDSESDGDAKDLKDSLSKSDFAKAQEDVDKLKKKIKSKKLDAKEAEQLKQQLKDLQTGVERLSRNKIEQKKLQDLIEKAKKEGRDAESLERELAQMIEEAKQLETMKRMASTLSNIVQALEKNDSEGVEANLDNLSKQLGELDDMVQDLEDADEHLQNLKALGKKLAKEMCDACGDCDGNCPGDKWSNKAGKGSSKRPENPDAQTEYEDARQRTQFNPRGRKIYKGAVNGPGFTKKSTLELEGEIKQAAQEAPNAIEVQRLPPSAREMVKEYFENLGGEKPEAKKP